MNILSYVYPITLATHHSKINGDILVVEQRGKKIIYVNGVQQSGGTITTMWKKVAQLLNDREYSFPNILVMGVAGGSAIQVLEDYYPHSKMTGIEIDPVMIEIGKKYFSLDTYKNLTLVRDDVIHWVSSAHKKHSFDLIVIDVYIGSAYPRKTREDIFLKQSKKLLNKRGLIVYNCHYQNKDSLEYERFLKRCKCIYKQSEEVTAYPFNRVLLLQ